MEAFERATEDLWPTTCKRLGISRATGYAQANRFLATGGKEGIPCIRCGKRILVGKVALMKMLQCGGKEAQGG